MTLINFQDVALKKIDYMKKAPGLAIDASGHFNFKGKVSRGFLPLIDRKTTSNYYFHANYMYYYVNDYFFPYNKENTLLSYEAYIHSLIDSSRMEDFSPEVVAINNHFDFEFLKDQYEKIVKFSAQYGPYYYIYVLPEFINDKNLSFLQSLGIAEIRTTSFYSGSDITEKLSLINQYGFLCTLEEPSHINFIDRIEKNITDDVDLIQLKEIVYDKQNDGWYKEILKEFNVYKGIKYHIYNEGLPYVLMQKYNKNIFDYDSLIQNLCYTRTDDPSIMVFFEVNRHIFI